MPHIYAHRNIIPKTMRALAKIDPVPGLKLIEALVPTPGPGEVLIRVKRTALGIETTHIDQWDQWAQRNLRPPLIVGHESVGLVASTGPGVTDFHPGEMVISHPFLACGNCRQCLAGRRHLCRAARRLGRDRDGACADYVCLPQSAVWHADPRLPVDILACFVPLGQAVQIARRFDLLGAHVLVAGASSLGCMVAAVARHAGARHVIVADANPAGLALAQTIPGIRTIDLRDASIGDLQRELAIDAGFDFGIETSGLPSSLGDLLAHLRPGGQIALLAATTGEVSLNTDLILNHRLSLHGLQAGEPIADWERLTLALQNGLDVSRVITYCLPCGSFREALDRAAAGEPGRILLDWDC